MQDLLEAVKPVLEEEQLQDAVESLLMESSSFDAKIMYNAMKVWNINSILATTSLRYNSNVNIQSC